MDSGEALETVRREHEGYAASHAVWGVPVFVVDDSAVFVRLLRQPGSDDEGRRSVEQILDLVSWRELNEFRRASQSRRDNSWIVYGLWLLHSILMNSLVAGISAIC